MNLPLDDHAAMYISASGSRVHPPCIGLIQRFDQPIPRETIMEHIRTLTSNPLGVGRRVVRPTVPGARARWAPAPEIPEWAVHIDYEPHSPEALAALLDEQISAQPDPLRNHGWRYTAVATEDGGMIIVNWINHALGDARTIIGTVFAPRDDGKQPPVAVAAPAATAPRRSLATEEVLDLAQRLRTGAQGTVRLAREAAVASRRRSQRGEQLSMLTPTVQALRRRRPQVGALSSRRVTALARLPYANWRAVAGEYGGSSNTLFVAMNANLIRQARLARGEELDRPLRILMPIDIRGFLESIDRAPGPSANTVISSVLEFDAGAEIRADLTAVRAATKRAIESAVVGVMERKSSSHRPAGIVDAMDLLPKPLTHRLAALVQSDYDGVASNIGPVPEHTGILGPYMASDMFLVATPMRTDLTGVFGHHDGRATISFVADPARLGPAGTLRERVDAELRAWGLEGEIF
jgi:hypothetical protein